MKKNKENLLKKMLKSENGVKFLNFKDKPNLYSKILTIPEVRHNQDTKNDNNDESMVSIKKLSDKLDDFIRTNPQKIMKMMKVENLLKNQNKNNYITNTVNRSSFIKNYTKDISNKSFLINKTNDIVNKSFLIDKTNKINHNTTNNQEQIENSMKNMNYELLTKNITNVINKNKNTVKIPMFHNGGTVLEEQPALVGGATDDSGKLEPEIIAPQSNIMEMLEGLGSNIITSIQGFLGLEPTKQNPSAIASEAMGENSNLKEQNLKSPAPAPVPTNPVTPPPNPNNNGGSVNRGSSSTIGSGKSFLRSTGNLPAWRTTLG